jgi:hypothetical protein
LRVAGPTLKPGTYRIRRRGANGAPSRVIHKENRGKNRELDDLLEHWRVLLMDLNLKHICKFMKGLIHPPLRIR